jgi:SAM-dependent methyltransferase
MTDFIIFLRILKIGLFLVVVTHVSKFQRSMNNQAHNYHTNSNYQKNTGIDFITFGNFAPGYLVVDMGCGPGNLTIEIENLVGVNGHVYGIDPDIERIQVARNSYSQFSNVSFIEGSVTNPNINVREKCDRIFANYSLHWVKDIEKAMQVIYNMMKSNSGSQLLLQNMNGIPDWGRKIEQILEIEYCNVMLNGLEYKSYIKSAERAGLKVVYQEVWVDMLPWKDANSFCNWFFPTIGGIYDRNAMTKEKWEKIEELVKSGMKASIMRLILEKP